MSKQVKIFIVVGIVLVLLPALLELALRQFVELH